MKRFVSIATTSVLLSTLSGAFCPVQGSVIARQMSFEEVFQGAEVVVLASVVEIPELAVSRPGVGAFRANKLRVERYLKGHGPNEITVMTRGGKFVQDTATGPRVLIEHTSDSDPQLPPEGTEVLLFLRNSTVGYVIYSATHGVVLVEKAPHGSQTVLLRFSRPDIMPESARREYDNYVAGGRKGQEKTFAAQVPLEALDALVQRVQEKRP